MGIRETITEKPAVGIVIAVVAFGFLGFMLLGDSGPDPRGGAGNVWYYDLTAGELVAAPLQSQKPPVTLSNGNQGVIAYVASCGACTPEEWYIRYLEKYSDQVKQQLEAAADSEAGHVMRGLAAPEVAKDPKGGELQWQSSNSPGGQQIMAEMNRHCSGKAGKPCKAQAQ